MARRKKKKTNPISDGLAWFIILPLLGANIYAGLKIARMAKKLELPIYGTLNNGPSQLSLLLLANCVVIALLAVVKIK